MTGVADVLKQHFGWAMDLCLESYEVLPDGRSFVRSDRDERAIAVFDNLLETVDTIPASLIETTERLRSAAPEKFEDKLQQKVDGVGFGISPANAAEFLDGLNRVSLIDDESAVRAAESSEPSAAETQSIHGSTKSRLVTTSARRSQASVSAHRYPMISSIAS
jgi:hypothetical protein